MKDRTDILLDEVEKLAFGLKAPNTTTPQIISCILELKRLHGENMFYIQDIGGSENAHKTCSDLKSMGLSDRLCFTQLTAKHSRKKSYPIDIAMDAVNSIYGSES